MDVEIKSIEKQGVSAQKNASPLLVKRTPKFYNTLKKNPATAIGLSQNLANAENEHHLPKNFSKTKKKSKILTQKKSKSIYIQRENEEDFGFVKNKVEIVNKNQNLKKSIYDGILIRKVRCILEGTRIRFIEKFRFGIWIATDGCVA